MYYLKAQGSYGGAIAQEIWYSPKLRAPARMVYYFSEGSTTFEIAQHVKAANSALQKGTSTGDQRRTEMKLKECQEMVAKEVAPMKKLSPELVQKILDLEAPPKKSSDGSLDTTAAEQKLVAECLTKSS